MQIDIIASIKNRLIGNNNFKNDLSKDKLLKLIKELNNIELITEIDVNDETNTIKIKVNIEKLESERNFREQIFDDNSEKAQFDRIMKNLIKNKDSFYSKLIKNSLIDLIKPELEYKMVKTMNLSTKVELSKVVMEAVNKHIKKLNSTYLNNKMTMYQLKTDKVRQILGMNLLAATALKEAKFIFNKSELAANNYKQSKIIKKRPFLRLFEYYGQNLHEDDYEDDESSYEMDIYEESESDNNSPIDHLPHHIGAAHFQHPSDFQSLPNQNHLS
jgi:hypothetical protein